MGRGLGLGLGFGLWLMDLLVQMLSCHPSMPGVFGTFSTGAKKVWHRGVNVFARFLPPYLFRVFTMHRGKGKGKQAARARLITAVTTEVLAQAAARRRAHAQQCQQRRREAMRLVIDLNPGHSSPPSDSDAEALENNFRSGPSPMGPTAPKNPFNSHARKHSKDTPFPDMPRIVATAAGLLCIFCAHATGSQSGKGWARCSKAPARICGC